MTQLSPDEVYKLMCEAQDEHAVTAHEVPESAIKGEEQAKQEDIEEMFKGMRKHTTAPSLGLLSAPEVGEIPKSFSLRQYVRARESQGGIGSCTSWGVTGVVETKDNIKTGLKRNFAEARLWKEQKEQPNSWISATTATKYWTVLQDYWPYPDKQGKPGWENARVCVPTNPRELSNLDQMKLEISRGNPVVFSFSANFNGFAPNGWVNPAHVQQNGGHCVFAVEYFDDNRFPGGGYGACPNSWGPDAHGTAKGWLYFPYSYITDGFYWVNMICFSQELVYKDAVNPAPVPPAPKPVNNHDVKCEVSVISKSPRQGGGIDYVYDWKIVGPDAGTVSKTEEKFFQDYGFDRPAKPVKAVDMSLEAKSYIGSYAANWSPGKIKVTFSDGFTKEVELKFP